MIKEKFNQEIADKATQVLATLEKKVTKLNKSSYDYRLEVLNLYNQLEVKFFAFCDSTGVKKQNGWKDYFQPELEKTYENLSWSYSNLKRFRNIAASEALKADYLKGIISKGKGNSRTDLQKFESALKSVNTLIPLLKDVVSLSLAEDGTLLLTKLVEEIALTPAEQKQAMENFILLKKQGLAKDLVNPEVIAVQ